MANDVQDLILEQLSEIRADIREMRTEQRKEMRVVESRVSKNENSLTAIRVKMVSVASAVGAVVGAIAAFILNLIQHGLAQ